ncbi:hypothetical protein [Luteolibacter sp. Populi]|uniref:hypothetical protein n=1 Tax=Luteolibacter sp. Populi TaxID=3230487 RepID=UPI00346639A6
MESMMGTLPYFGWLSWRMVFDDGAANEKFRDFIVAANEQNFDRLEAMVDSGDA